MASDQRPTTFTLDTNCIVALDERRAEAAAVRALVDAHLSGRTDVAIVAISASENQRGGAALTNFALFQERLRQLGLDHLRVLQPMAYLDVTFFDYCILADAEMEQLEQQIHNLLFPHIEFFWEDYCQLRQQNREMRDDTRCDWRNAKCDVQAIWSHIHHHRDVFVTADTNFLGAKREALISLGARRIHTPKDAAALLCN